MDYLDYTTRLDEARAEGLAEGKAKVQQEKLDSARRMKADGLTPEQIQKYTGLPPEDIKAL
jgi:predicted transposase/invertase (TIGR01784 family)